MKSQAGAGSVDQLPSGRWRARVTVSSGDRESLGTFEAEEEARSVLNAALTKLADGEIAPVGGLTLKKYGERWLARRERIVVDSKGDASTWKKHVDTAHFAGWPVAAITKKDVREWVDALLVKSAQDVHRGDRTRRKLSRQRVVNIINLLRVAMRDAVEDDVIKTNPVVGVRLPKKKETVEHWTYLTLEEQKALLAACPIPFRYMVAFAIGAGLRKSEQWLLHMGDVHLDGPDPHVVVRFGSRGRSTKSGKIRRVPLFGLSLWGAEMWRDNLRAYLGKRKNAYGLFFPSETGVIRSKYRDYGLDDAIAAAGIGRPVRWHDLRHTCASSLVAGWWDRPWRLEEVQKVLGHASITTTERYAHLADSVLKLAARETEAAWSRGGHNVMQPNEITHVANEFVNRRSRVQVSKSAPAENKLRSRFTVGERDHGVTDEAASEKPPFPLAEATGVLRGLLAARGSK